MKQFAICFFSVALLGVANHAFGTNILYFTSAPVSVGNGATRTLTPADGFSFSGVRIFNQGVYTNAVEFDLFSSTEDFHLDLVGPNSTLPTVRTYLNAERFGFQDTGHPGMAFHGDASLPNTITGSFQVLEATYSSSGNLLTFAADFTQYDNGNTAHWNIGSLRFNSDIPITTVPEPPSLILAGLGLVGLIFVANSLHRSKPSLLSTTMRAI